MTPRAANKASRAHEAGRFIVASITTNLTGVVPKQRCWCWGLVDARKEILRRRLSRACHGTKRRFCLAQYCQGFFLRKFPPLRANCVMNVSPKYRLSHVNIQVAPHRGSQTRQTVLCAALPAPHAMTTAGAVASIRYHCSFCF